MNDFLTKDNRHLKLFQDNIVIDKRLPKWRRAEAGVKKTNVSGYNENSTNIITNNVDTFLISNAINTTPDYISDYKRSDSFDPDSNLDATTKWLPLYETPEGVSFDELATAGISDLTRLIVEKKIKYVMAGYGSFGNTIGSLTYTSNVEETETYSVRLIKELSDKINQEPWYKKLWNRITKGNKSDKSNKNEENEQPMDALKFFSLVKSSSKESVAIYKDRVSKYLTALHNATNIGQTALQEELIRGLITNRYESVLYAEGCYYAVTEELVAKFASQCEKGLKLSYLKNFSRPIPQDVIDKIAKMNELEVFDNYVILYYDPDGKIYKETAYEEAKRRDPIIFGVIAGSKKLYYIADWIDEYCDLTLDAFVDALGIEKDDLHFDAEEIKKNKLINEKK
jgi:hypothetical protein